MKDKRTITVRLPEENWNEEILIKDAISDLKEFKSKGSDRIKIINGYGSFIIGPFSYREETDEEYNRRIGEEEQEIKNQELAELERLKRKYENEPN